MAKIARGNSRKVRQELVQQLYQKARAERWALARDRFAHALDRSVAHRFGSASVSAGEVEAYLASLHAEDLALACSCSEGSVPAWEHFIQDFRQDLYRAGRAVAGEEHGRELADSLYAELYGLGPRGAQRDIACGDGPPPRQSLFDYYYGRSKLMTWLRAVLAQRHVDRFREACREPAAAGGAFEDGEPPKSIAEAAGSGPPDPDRLRYLALLREALEDELAALAARDRLRLCYYYVQDLTLAQIGRLLGEHEATVSRKLDRTRSDLRERVEKRLRKAKRLSEAQVRLCFEYALEDWPFDLTRALSGGS